MCWSKRVQEDEDLRPKTNRNRMATITECPGGFEPCLLKKSETLCSGHGLCCYKGDEESGQDKICVCYPGWNGTYCQNPTSVYESRIKFKRTEAIAAFSAVLGVIVITLFVALVVLQIKYYRRRKIRRRIMLADGDHELNKISRPDASDRGSKKVLIIQPGYSWRESVRRTGSKAAHKFRNTLSRSVPDDMFGVGLKLAIFGGFKPSDQQSTVGKGEFKAPTTLRCFSADPALGDRQTICDQKDNANANNQPIPVQIPTAAAAIVVVARTEDTVK